jgi:thiol-disulfide isomerase/thioredoxin|tara:strand:+ start:32 stop:421 length:390 start_codon:yes stop_codon:yes gene_type:complete
MKKFLVSLLFLITLNANSMEKETTFNQKLFSQAQSEGKVIIVSSWIKYCSSCLGQMKILQKAKNDGKLNDIKFDDIEYFSFDVTNKDIANFFNVQYQTTLIIFKNNKEVYRSLGETTKDLLYEAIKSSI